MNEYNIQVSLFYGITEINNLSDDSDAPVLTCIFCPFGNDNNIIWPPAVSKNQIWLPLKKKCGHLF